MILRPKVASPPLQAKLLSAVRDIARGAPFQHPRTRGGGMTSAAMTNAGDAGWWSDRSGYRYLTRQPGSEQPWPPLPEVFREAVALAVEGSPWAGFEPDACLINFYQAGAKMGLHQDRDERDFTQPIVTISLGDDADFLIGGLERADKTTAVVVSSGDGVLMGPPGRMLFHGIRKIYPGTSRLAGLEGRISLTFRKAL
ncbi:MAG: alpha-ketoglutarate-dependent dioxygenase AlkB [Rhodospirillaceae bacterium]